MRHIALHNRSRLTLHLTAVMGLITIALTACSPEQLVGSGSLPTDLSDPASTHTPAGATSAYRGVLAQLRTAFGGASSSFVLATGLLSDELQDQQIGGPVGLVSSANMSLDGRLLPEYTNPILEGAKLGGYREVYSHLQQMRGQASEAMGLLRDYAPGASPALRGHLFAVQGYAEVMLADLFCSGIPLSTLDYGGGYTLHGGSSTTDVYQNAIALFDSALALSADSSRFLNLARMGKGRALLATGDFAAAAAAVSDVPDGYRYEVSYTAASGLDAENFAVLNEGMLAFTVADQEGGNGFAYRTSGDPRTLATIAGTNQYGSPLFHPSKYASSGDTPVVLADWVEARLIQAEAALHSGNGAWLTSLNALRTDGTFDTQPNSADPTKTDTLWHAGTAGVPNLAPLGDPGALDTRVDLLFHERAFWLYLTGHRQGDLRRLIRSYGRFSSQVYPSGAYSGGIGNYGNDVTAPIPASERVSNSQFTGCLNRGA